MPNDYTLEKVLEEEYEQEIQDIEDQEHHCKGGCK